MIFSSGKTGELIKFTFYFQKKKSIKEFYSSFSEYNCGFIDHGSMKIFKLDSILKFNNDYSEVSIVIYM